MTEQKKIPKGLIGLDIDGTTAAREDHRVPDATVDYLTDLSRAGWQIAFITGRNFAFAAPVLQQFSFLSYLAVQNGATLMELPSGKVLQRHYLGQPALSAFVSACENEESDVVVYAGYEQGDRCYYRPQKFSKELYDYLQRRLVEFGEDWHPVDAFEELAVQSFSSLKCFGTWESMKRVSRRVAKEVDLNFPVISDPFDASCCIGQATARAANKGIALRYLYQHIGATGPCIAAGDDHNDHSLLEAADIGIAMGQAPDDLKAIADFVAPPVESLGLLDGLAWALEQRS